VNTHSNRCSARKSNGQPCKAYPIHGTTVCRVHGGSAPQVRAAAKARLAEAKARQEAAKYVHNAPELADPLGELLRVAGQMVAFKDFMGERVAQMQAEEYRYKSGQGLEQLRSEISLFTQAMSQVAKVIESMAKLDLEARRTRVQEQEIALLSQALDNILTRLELTDDQRSRSSTIIVEELQAIAEVEEAAPAYRGRSEPAALTRAR
jgi:hypothetical protein